MKILALRGRNIASLAGDFALDFETGVLAQTGLFAITGPTGAGKSSLLDAACLALFDNTPRLSMDPGKAEIGYEVGDEGQPDGDHLRSNDVRGLMTRGTASGFAEVDFRGIDGQRYRARWSVQRARMKTSGRLQAQKITFENLDSNEQLTETKTDTLKLISAKLGLNFHQFRRSILLAQGDFAAFLRAKATERGELLERMTGTDLYARLSVAAFARAKEERLALQALESQLDNAKVLDDEARKQLDDHIAQLVEDDKANATVIKELERELAWYVLRDKLASNTKESLQELATKLELWANHEPEGWKPPNLAEANVIQTFAKAVRERLTQATKLDALLSAALVNVDEASAEKKVLDEKRSAVAKAAQEAERKAAATASEREELIAWLAANAQTELIAKDWALYEKELRAHADAHANLAAIRTQESELARKQPAADEALEDKESALATARDELKASKVVCENAETKLSGIPIEEVRAKRETGRKKTVLLDKRRELIEAFSKLEATVAAQTEAREKAQAQVVSLTQARSKLDGRIEQAEDDLKRARAMLDLSGRRKELVADEPCPLCGSLDHPYAQNDPGAKRLVNEQEATIKTLKKERDGCINELARQEAAAKTAEKAIGDGERHRQKLNREADANAASWQELADDDTQPLPTADKPDALSLLDAHRGVVSDANEKLDEVLSRYDVIAKEVGEARRIKDTCQTKVDNAAKVADEARVLVAKLEADADKVASARSHANQVQDSSLLVLGKVFVGDEWRTELLTNPKAYIGNWRKCVRELGRKRESLASCDSRLPAERVDQDAKKEQLAKLAVDCERASTKLADRKSKLLGHQTARGLLFAGHATEVVEAELVAIEAIEGQRVERTRALAEHETQDKPMRTVEALQPVLETHRLKAKETRERLDADRGNRAVDDAARKRRDALGSQIEQQRAQSERWGDLDQLIGSAKGTKFREFAQGLTLRIVIEYANQQLHELRPRYSLMAVPRQNLEMQIVDHDMGDEVRTVSSLSGGESFLVSLALALGLAASGGTVAEVETLFIDEGFGALDDDTVGGAIATLDALQATGRTIGVISHLDGLADRLGVNVKVSPVGGGLSKVEVVEA